MWKKLGACGYCKAWGWVWWVYGPSGRGYLCRSPNVIVVAVLVTFLILDFGNKLIEKIPVSVGPEVLALLIGTGIGGLIAAMMRMFEQPSVPADVHERMMRGLTNVHREGKE